MNHAFIHGVCFSIVSPDFVQLGKQWGIYVINIRIEEQSYNTLRKHRTFTITSSHVKRPHSDGYLTGIRTLTFPPWLEATLLCE